MKKFLLTIVLIGGVAILGAGLLDSIKNKPAQGTVEVEEVKCPTEHVINDMGECVPVGDMNVPTEEEVAEEPIVTEEVVEEVKPVFTPLAFDGKLTKFAQANKGMIIKLKGNLSVEKYGVSAKKGVVVGSDVYFKAKDGNLYVIHKGELIKL